MLVVSRCLTGNNMKLAKSIQGDIRIPADALSK